MLILVAHANDDEDEQEALHISFLTIGTGYPLLYLVEGFVVRSSCMDLSR